VTVGFDVSKDIINNDFDSDVLVWEIEIWK